MKCPPRRDPGQAIATATAQQMEKHRFGLVVLGVPGGDTVRADLVGKHLADGSTADAHPHLVKTCLAETVDNDLHVGHRGGEKSAHADDACPVLPGGPEKARDSR